MSVDFNPVHLVRTADGVYQTKDGRVTIQTNGQPGNFNVEQDDRTGAYRITGLNGATVTGSADKTRLIFQNSRDNTIDVQNGSSGDMVTLGKNTSGNVILGDFHDMTKDVTGRYANTQLQQQSIFTYNQDENPRR